MLLLALTIAHADEATREARMQEPPTVRDIHFEETLEGQVWACRVLWPGLCRLLRGTSDNQVRAVMDQQEDGFGAHLLVARRVVERPPLEEETLMTDAWSVELWYAHHGWFDARVVGWEVVEVEPRGRLARWIPRWRYGIPQAPVVDVIAHVEEGPRSLIREVTIDGDEIAGPALERRIDRAAQALVGTAYINSKPYGLARYVEDQLRRVGFARASAEVRMLARPEDQEVDIFIAVEPGEICVFGEVEVVGNVAVSEEDILQRVTILPGERYDPDAMNETQRNLFGQGTFAVVQVIPQFEVPGQQIPIRIEVTEANFREVKIGGGAATGGSQGEVRGRIAAEHRNLFGRLIRVDIDATAGQRVYSTNSAPGLSALAAARNQDLSEVAGTVSTGPFAQVDADLVWPEFLGIRRLSHTPETSYELAFEQLQTYHDVSLAPAFTWRPMPKLAITPIYRWEYRFFMERDPSVFSPTLDEVERGLNDWSVQSFQLRANWNTAQPFFQPTHGWYVDVSVLNAGGPLEGFTWAQGDLDIRKYQAVAVNDFRGVLAFRVAGGYQRAYGDDGHVPSWKRYRLGGATDVRGYAQDYLGPRACFAQHPKTGLPATLDADGSVVTDADGNPVAPQSIPCSSIDRRERVVYPLGGTLSALGSVELRIELPYNMQAVVFHDLGQVWPDPRYWSLRELSPTAGVGLRYPTPAGPARLDLGVRYLHWTDREPAYAADRFFGVYIAVGEAF